MPQLDHLPGRAFRQNGTEWLYFSGTAYLGMPHVPAFREAVVEGMAHYGTNFGGSRRSNLQLAVFAEAEQTLAQWIGTEAALTVSSGSLAGQLLVRFLQQQGPCHFAPNVHPALWPSDGQQRSGSWVSWLDDIHQIETTADAPVQLFCSSVDPLRAMQVSFDWLQELPADRGFRVIVDDSHGLGVLGEGSGVYGLLPSLPHVEYIVVGSLAKGPGLPGGAIFGRQALIDALWRSPFFIGASPMVPAYLYAWLYTREILREQWLRLRKNVSWLEEHWPPEVAVRHQAGYPVFYLPDAKIAQALSAQQIMISSFPYPGPEDPVINRIVVNALHQPEDLEKLINQLDYHP